jgi:putative tricarboxylic transport membrane protein
MINPGSVTASLLSFITALLAACGTAGANAQAWTPQRNVEIVVTSAPGGSNDRTARQVEKSITENRLLGVTLSIVNRPGGNGNIAYTYVNQHAGDAHYLLIGTPTLLTNHITGQGGLYYNDFTPVASLFNDYTVFAVNAAPGIRDGRDLAERIRKDPRSVSARTTISPPACWRKRSAPRRAS